MVPSDVSTCPLTGSDNGPQSTSKNYSPLMHCDITTPYTVDGSAQNGVRDGFNCFIFSQKSLYLMHNSVGPNWMLLNATSDLLPRPLL